MDVRVGLWRRLSTEELTLLNFGVGEDSWESLGLQGDPTNQSILKEISPGISLEGMMLKLKLQYFGHAKSWLIGKDSAVGKDWGQEEKGTTKDEMAGWHHGLNGRESEWSLGDSDGQGGLACCDSWGGKSRTRLSAWTELNWTDSTYVVVSCHSVKYSVLRETMKGEWKVSTSFLFLIVSD